MSALSPRLAQSVRRVMGEEVNGYRLMDLDAYARFHLWGRKSGRRVTVAIYQKENSLWMKSIRGDVDIPLMGI